MMERIMNEHLAMPSAKADRSWMRSEKIINSFSHPPLQSDLEQGDIFTRGQLVSSIERKKIVL